MVRGKLPDSLRGDGSCRRKFRNTNWRGRRFRARNAEDGYRVEPWDERRRSYTCHIALLVGTIAVLTSERASSFRAHARSSHIFRIWQGWPCRNRSNNLDPCEDTTNVPQMELAWSDGPDSSKVGALHQITAILAGSGVESGCLPWELGYEYRAGGEDRSLLYLRLSSLLLSARLERRKPHVA